MSEEKSSQGKKYTNSIYIKLPTQNKQKIPTKRANKGNAKTSTSIATTQPQATVSGLY